jgi:hypothetical protein
VDALPALSGRVRGTLVGVAVGLVLVFTIALKLDPYRDGLVWRRATHTQLGLPPCHFLVLTGLPCPSCGMTTSFALLVRGDVVGALRANSVGVLLAVFCLALIPWCLASGFRNQPLFVRSLERTTTCLVTAFLWLLLVRWVVVLGLLWWSGAV